MSNEGGGRGRWQVAAALCVLALLALASPAALAADAPEPQRALLDLEVNKASTGTVLVVLLGEDVFVEPSALSEAGLEDLHGIERSFDGVRMLSLQSLSPGLSFSMDPEALSLSITADPTLFAASTRDVRSSARPEDLIFRSDLSGFLNYSIEAAANAGFGGFTELGASYKTWLFSTGLQRSPGASHSVRTLTSLTYDQPSLLRRWVFGESIASSGILGGGALLLGAGVHREYSLDPYRTHLPLPQLTGMAATPSTLDLYVNGQFVRSEQIPTGAFDLQNLPVPAGAASVRYVLRDAYGRTQEFNSRFYLASELLPVGETDYAYNLGFLREEAGTKSFSFDPHPLLVAHHRMGLTDHFTAGGRVEIGPTLLSGGPSVAFGLPFGELKANLAASVSNELAGTAGQLSYTFQVRQFAAGISGELASRFYSRVGLTPLEDRRTSSLDFFFSQSFATGLTVFGAYRHEGWRDHPSTDSLEVRASYSVDRWGALLLGAQRTTLGGGIPNYSASFAVAFNFGERASGQLSTERTRDRTRVALDLQQSLPTGTGLGYRLHGDDQGGSEALMFQSQYGRYEGDYTNEYGSEGAQAFAAGSLVLAGGKVFAARPIQQGYAVVRVPGVANVRTLLNNQEVGRTDEDGDILVPNLLPYYGNRIAIVPADIPIDYEIPPLEQVIATPNRGGGLVTFHAYRIVGYSGSVILREGLFRLPPTYGQLDVRTEDGMKSSPLGKEGEFYLENLPPGDYPAHVHSDGGDCDFVLTIPDRPEKFVDLGVHYCHGKFNTPMTFTQAHAQAAK